MKKKVNAKVIDNKIKQTTLSMMIKKPAPAEHTQQTEQMEDTRPQPPTPAPQRFTKLPREFFREEVVALSKKLLGKVIRRDVDGQTMRVRIVETEAYKAPEDKGCHAYNNKKTERTKAFWCDAGCWYVYTIYMKTNLCLNVVAADKDVPEAVLVRAGHPLEGVGLMQKFRGKEGRNKPADIVNLTNGPGKLGQALNIGLDYSCRDMCEETCDAFIEDDSEFAVADEDIETTARINIDYAEEYKDKPWRFYIRGDKFVSQK